jgi:hypothetical protein
VADCAGAQAVIVGAVASITVRLVVQVAVFPAPSVTVTVTDVTPRPTSVAAAGAWERVTGPQLSLATVAAAKSGSAA